MKRSLAREFKTVEIALRMFYSAARDNDPPTGCEKEATEALEALQLIKQESEELRAVMSKNK